MRGLLLALRALLAVPAAAQSGEAIEIGRSHRLASIVMGAERTINVWLPPGYAEGTRRYPVLYLLDGGTAQDFHHISGLVQLGGVAGTTREMILVGIETVDRRRELAGPTTDPQERADYPTAGEAARFRRFIAQEVKPWVERRYRTDGDDGLIGESLAGLFVVDTLLAEPDLFDRYIAVSPSLWWSDRALLGQAPARLRALPAGERWLWLAVADEGEAMGVDALAAVLRRDAPADLHWSFTPMPGESHATVFHPAALKALRALYRAE